MLSVNVVGSLLVALHQLPECKPVVAFLSCGALHILAQLLDTLKAFLLVVVVVQAAQVKAHLLRHSYKIDLVRTVVCFVPRGHTVAFVSREADSSGVACVCKLLLGNAPCVLLVSSSQVLVDLLPFVTDLRFNVVLAGLFQIKIASRVLKPGAGTSSAF